MVLPDRRRVVDRDARPQGPRHRRPTDRLGTFGFLLPHKGTLELIRAIDLVRRERPDVLLLAPCALHPDPVARARTCEECQAEIDRRGLGTPT